MTRRAVGAYGHDPARFSSPTRALILLRPQWCEKRVCALLAAATVAHRARSFAVVVCFPVVRRMSRAHNEARRRGCLRSLTCSRQTRRWPRHSATRKSRPAAGRREVKPPAIISQRSCWAYFFPQMDSAADTGMARGLRASSTGFGVVKQHPCGALPGAYKIVK